MIDIYHSKHGYGEIYDETGHVGSFVARVNGEFFINWDRLTAVTFREMNGETGVELLHEASRGEQHDLEL